MSDLAEPGCCTDKNPFDVDGCCPAVSMQAIIAIRFWLGTIDPEVDKVIVLASLTDTRPLDSFIKRGLIEDSESPPHY